MGEHVAEGTTGLNNTTPPRSFAAARSVIETAVPTAVYGYFDRCEFDAAPSMAAAMQTKLESNGFDVREHERRQRPDGSTFVPPGWKLTLLVRDQTGPLLFASSLPGIVPKIAEIALDMVYGDENVAAAVHTAMATTIAQPWAGKRDVVTVFDTVYTGQRRYGRHHHWAQYGDEHCRFTGEIGCVHLENRRVGPQLLREIGIGSVKNMLNFNFAAFFKARLPQLFLHVDLQRLGRVHSNNSAGARRHKPRIDEYLLPSGRPLRYDRDRSRGAVVYHLEALQEDGSRSLQQFIKSVGRDPRFVTPIEVQHIIDRIQNVR